MNIFQNPARLLQTMFFLMALGAFFLLSRTPWGETLYMMALQPILQGNLWMEKKSSPPAPSRDSQIIELQEQLLEAKEKLRQLSQLLPQLPPSYQLLSASILLHSTCSPQQKRIFIAGGKKHGIQKGQAILYANQVVGKVNKVFQSVSQVELLQDPGFKLSVRSQRTRKIFILESRENELKLKHVQFDMDIKEGDVLLTAGWEGYFPSGMVVGKVSKVGGKSHQLFLDVLVEPMVKMDELEQVFVVIPHLPEQKQ